MARFLMALAAAIFGTKKVTRREGLKANLNLEQLEDRLTPSTDLFGAVINTGAQRSAVELQITEFAQVEMVSQGGKSFLTQLNFSVNGHEGNVSRWEVYADLNNDERWDAVVATGTRPVFDNFVGGGLWVTDTPITLGIIGKVAGSLSENRTFQLGLGSVQAEDEFGAALAPSHVTLTGGYGPLFQLLNEGVLEARKPATPIMQQYLQAGTKSDRPIDSMIISAFHESFRIVEIHAKTIGSEARSEDRLKLFLEGHTNPIGYMLKGASDPAEGGFTANLHSGFVVAAEGQDTTFKVYGRTAPDTATAISGEPIQISIDRIVGMGETSGNLVTVHTDIQSPVHVVTFAKPEFANRNPDAEWTNMPVGWSTVGQVGVAATDNINFKEGKDGVVIGTVTWEMVVQNAVVDLDSLEVSNKANTTESINAVATDRDGNPITGILSVDPKLYPGGVRFWVTTELEGSVVNNFFPGGTWGVLTLDMDVERTQFDSSKSSRIETTFLSDEVVWYTRAAGVRTSQDFVGARQPDNRIHTGRYGDKPASTDPQPTDLVGKVIIPPVDPKPDPKPQPTLIVSVLQNGEATTAATEQADPWLQGWDPRDLMTAAQLLTKLDGQRKIHWPET